MRCSPSGVRGPVAGAAVHPAPPVRHRLPLARQAGPGAGSSHRRRVAALHVADDRLTALMHHHTLNADHLRSFALHKKHDVSEYTYSKAAPVRAMVCERPFQHSLRPAPEGGGFLGGFVMPYHALLDEFERQPELNPTDYMAFAPDDTRSQFSYGSEHVGHGAAAAALMAARNALERTSALLSGPWDRYIGWIDERLSRLWKLRGRRQGLGWSCRLCTPDLTVHCLRSRLRTSSSSCAQTSNAVFILLFGRISLVDANAHAPYTPLMAVTATQAIRGYELATGLGDVAARYRAVRLATRHLSPAQRYVPDNPRGGGAEAERLNARHHASMILALGAVTAAGAPEAVRQLETLVTRDFDPDPNPDGDVHRWWRQPYRGFASSDPNPDLAFLKSAPNPTLRSCMESWLEWLSALSPSEFDRLEKRMQKAEWKLN